MESSRLEQYQDAVLRDQKYRGKNGDDDHDDSGNDDVSLDELLEELGDDDGDEFMSRYREQRLQEMSDALKQIKKNVQEEEYGMVQTMLDENALMRLTTEKERIVIHFFLPSFKKCQVMDKSLDKLAEKHLMTKFLRINVEDCPFLVTKLNIKVLPCVIAYRHGVERDRVVGFSRLGNNPEEFALEALESVLLNAGVLLQKANKFTVIDKSNLRRVRNDTNGSDSDLDI